MLNWPKIPESEWVTGERIEAACKELHGYGVRFLKTDNLKKAPKMKDCKVLVTHRSDYSINEKRTKLKPPNCKKWFTQNLEYPIFDVTEALPIGLNTSATPVAGDLHKIYQKSLEPQDIRNLAYINFGDKTNKLRPHIRKKYKNESWVTVGKFDRSTEGHSRYIDDIHNHRFVFSPPGNGIDCVRTWLALYLGAIPIIEWSYHMLIVARSTLPVLFVKNWDDITEEFLVLKLREMANIEYDWRPMYMSYWIKKFKEAASE